MQIYPHSTVNATDSGRTRICIPRIRKIACSKNPRRPLLNRTPPAYPSIHPHKTSSPTRIFSQPRRATQRTTDSARRRNQPRKEQHLFEGEAGFTGGQRAAQLRSQQLPSYARSRSKPPTAQLPPPPRGNRRNRAPTTPQISLPSPLSLSHADGIAEWAG